MPLDTPTTMSAYRTDERPHDWLHGTLAMLGLFAALGIGLAILAFAAGRALDGLNFNDPLAFDLAGASLLVGILPLVAVPVLAAVGGWLAGRDANDAGDGAIAGVLGTLVGMLVLTLLVGVGYALGAASVNVDLARVAWPAGFYLRPGWDNTLRWLGTSAGVLYFLANLVTGALAGAFGGYLHRGYGARRVETERFVRRERMPRV